MRLASEEWPESTYSSRGEPTVVFSRSARGGHHAPPSRAGLWGALLAFAIVLVVCGLRVRHPELVTSFFHRARPEPVLVPAAPPEPVAAPMLAPPPVAAPSVVAPARAPEAPAASARPPAKKKRHAPADPTQRALQELQRAQLERAK